MQAEIMHELWIKECYVAWFTQVSKKNQSLKNIKSLKLKNKKKRKISPSPWEYKIE